MRMRLLHHRHRLLTSGALISAVALGAVTATQASASGGGWGHTPPKPPKSAATIGYHPTAEAPDDLNEANDAFAACMREHGEDLFPSFHAAKGSDGGVSFVVKTRVPEGKSPRAGSAATKKAFKVCKGPLEKAGVTFPNGGLVLPAPPKRVGGK
ncbi:hypothetical protein ACOKM5_12950 [Streptomyces sp. BH097]|uniref:hypothetical protein n=1 Tax=unclassified Streptomyces TaxID=2593676 RepID=UPI003BB77DDC